MSTQSEDDPEVQKNGFRAIVEAVDLNPDVLEAQGPEDDGFFDHHFDPGASWEENLDSFRSWVREYNQLFSGDVEELQDRIDDVGG